MEFFAFPENVQHSPKCSTANQCVSIPFTAARQTNPHTTDLELGNDKVSWLMAFVDTSTTEFRTLTWTHHCEVSLFCHKKCIQCSGPRKRKSMECHGTVSAQRHGKHHKKCFISKAHWHRKLRLRKCIKFRGSITEGKGWPSSLLTFAITHKVNLHNIGNEL